jgi:ABC-type xylose transport system substrate-binding protein
MDQARSALWRMVGDGLARAGRRRIALLGGGRHTRDLLSLGWAESHGLKVVAVLDDRPEDWRPEPAWPVCIPLATGANCRVDAVVASSDAAEATLVQRAKDSGLPGDRIIGVYATSGQSPC